MSDQRLEDFVSLDHLSSSTEKFMKTYISWDFQFSRLES